MLVSPRFTAWLCLALALFAGVSPAQGFVLCIEQDGCVSIEVKATDADCGGCDAHVEDEAPSQPDACPDEEPACPCIDLAVPGSPGELVTQIRTVEVQVGHWTAPSPTQWAQHIALDATPSRGPPCYLPRVCETLAQIRTVVLLI